MVNNSSSRAHIVMLFTLRINRLLLGARVSVVNPPPVDPLKVFNQTMFIFEQRVSMIRPLTENNNNFGANNDERLFN